MVEICGRACARVLRAVPAAALAPAGARSTPAHRRAGPPTTLARLAPGASSRALALAAAVTASLLAPGAAASEPVAGPPRDAVARPGGGATPACSFTVPVCIHPSPATPAWAARSVLAAAEAALSGYRALGLPMPLPDAARGGGPQWDVYIAPPDAYTSAAPPSPSAPPPAAPPSPSARPSTPAPPASPPDAYTFPANVYTSAGLTVADPEAEPRRFDEAAAFTLLPEPATWGCDLGSLVARHAAEALLLGLDAGAERAVLAASASYLASIVAPCAAVEAPAIDAFQAEPHRAITAPRPGAASGALLFPMYLEEESGSGDPGRLVASLLAIASQRTDPASPTWQNEPDVFDALRSSMRFRRGSLDDLLLGFAVERAFVGDRSDGQHLAATDLYGKAGRVFFEWSVPYASLPRRLAPADARALEPTGATYLWLDLAGAPPETEITFVADWELPAVFRWSLVKVDRSGAEAGRIDVAGIFGTSHAERTLVLREELAGVIIVGTFAGSLDRSRPFDPDAAPFMPHAYEVTLYGPLPPATAPPAAPSK